MSVGNGEISLTSEQALPRMLKRDPTTPPPRPKRKKAMRETPSYWPNWVRRIVTQAERKPIGQVTMLRNLLDDFLDKAHAR